MKKQILCLVLIFLLPFGLVGCSDEPVAFSEDLSNNKSCYLDVMEIRPMGDDGIYLYCKCILKNGKTAWMRITDYDYQEYFETDDFEDSSDYYGYMYKGVKYSTAVRLTGMVETIQNVMENKTSTIKAFYFTDADAKSTLNFTQQAYYANPYSSSLPADQYVYADITRINFTGMGTGTTLSLSTGIFNCTLTNGKTISIDVDFSDYSTYFDKSALFNTGSIAMHRNPSALNFIQPVRIYGITTSNSSAFAFKTASIDDIEAAKIENQPAVEFSETAIEKQKVFVTLQSIEPKYTVQSLVYYNIPSAQYYVCRSVCTDGKVVWLCMTAPTFTSDFLNTFVESDWGNINLELDSVVVNGTVQMADNFASDLAEKIGTDKVIIYSGKT